MHTRPSEEGRHCSCCARYQKEAAQLKQILDLLPHYIFVKDADGRFLIANKTVASHYGLTTEEIVGEKQYDLHPDKEEAEGMQQTDLEVITTGKGKIVTAKSCTGDQSSPQWLRIIKIPYDFDGDPTTRAVLGVGVDITEHKLLEERANKMNDLLLLRSEELEAANNRMAKFLATMSHEMRTPLNGVIGMASLLLEDADHVTETNREYLNTIKVSSDFLLSIIDNVLDFSKLESSMMSLECEPVNIRECVEIVMNLLSPTAAAAGLDLYYKIDTSLPEWLVADGGRLVQVIVNLTANAIKFTAEGSVAIEVQWKENPLDFELDSELDMLTDTVFIDSLYPNQPQKPQRTQRQRHGTIAISVQDTGIGIAKRNQDLLFNAYTQLDINNKRKYGGTGLGLAISFHLVQLMNGRIWIESDGVPGKGSKFIFTIPLSTPMTEYSPRQQTNGEAIDEFSPPPLSPRSLLPLAPISNISPPRGTKNNLFKRSRLEAFGSMAFNGSRGALSEVSAYVLSLSELSQSMMRSLCGSWGLNELRVTNSFEEISYLWSANSSSSLFRDTARVLIVDLPAGKQFVEANSSIIAQLTERLDWSPVILLLPNSMQSFDVPSRFHVVGKPLKHVNLYNAVLHIFSSAVTRNTDGMLLKPPVEKSVPEMRSRVLVADDNQINRTVITHLLHRLGYTQLVIVENGLEAVQACRQIEFDVCLLDVIMPEMDGMEAARQIAQLFNTTKSKERRPRLVALTADATKEAEMECLGNGFDAFLTKPINIQRLKATLQQFQLS